MSDSSAEPSHERNLVPCRGCSRPYVGEMENIEMGAMMSDRARELAERIARMNNPEEITPILADALELAEQGQFSRTMSHMTKKVAEAEQRGYNAGLKHAADEATHGNGQHSVEIASRILALIGSPPATNEFDAKRTEAK